MIRSYTEILLTMADALDSYIAPKKITRSDTNFLYLLLKAIAKGYEVINNAIEVLRNKFNPESCADADLLSVAKIAGTEFKLGSGSGLLITITNTGVDPVNLEIGEYAFDLDDDTVFEFPIEVVTQILPAGSVDVIAFTTEKGAFPVEAIAEMTVYEKSAIPISSDLVFSCVENSGMLGSLDETNVEFRKRILSDVTRKDTIKELELAIQNLPFIIACKLIFNQTILPVVVEGITIPPYHLLITILGAARKEIAQVVAEKSIYTTVEVDPADVIYYDSDVFIGGQYPVYFRNFSNHEFSVNVRYAFNSLYNTVEDIEAAIDTALRKFQNPTKYKQFITEGEFYDEIRALDLPGFQLLDITLFEGAVEVTHISVPETSLPKLMAVTYDAEDIL